MIAASTWLWFLHPCSLGWGEQCISWQGARWQHLLKQSWHQTQSEFGTWLVLKVCFVQAFRVQKLIRLGSLTAKCILMMQVSQSQRVFFHKVAYTCAFKNVVKIHFPNECFSSHFCSDWKEVALSNVFSFSHKGLFQVSLSTVSTLFIIYIQNSKDNAFWCWSLK